MNDGELQSLLAASLAPVALDVYDNKALERMLDAAMPAGPVSKRLPWWLAAAAVVAIAALVGISMHRGGGEGGAPIATGGDGGVGHRGADGGERVEIFPEFPKPMFVGTPVSAERSNLDLSKSPRSSFMAPPGTVLLSLDAEVTSSDPEPIIGELAMVTDGDKDAVDGSYVELGPGRQWVQVDLGQTRAVWTVLVWHFHKNARAYDDVIVQVSDDPAFASGVTEVFNNDHDASSGMGAGAGLAWIETNHGRIVEVGGTRARYVRLYSNGNTANEMNHYVEIEIYGQ